MLLNDKISPELIPDTFVWLDQGQLFDELRSFRQTVKNGSQGLIQFPPNRPSQQFPLIFKVFGLL